MQIYVCYEFQKMLEMQSAMEIRSTEVLSKGQHDSALIPI